MVEIIFSSFFVWRKNTQGRKTNRRKKFGQGAVEPGRSRTRGEEERNIWASEHVEEGEERNAKASKRVGRRRREVLEGESAWGGEGQVTANA
jgi:hypothetical protein